MGSEMCIRDSDEADDVERQLPIDLATHEDEFSVSPLKHWQQLPVLLLAPA